MRSLPSFKTEFQLFSLASAIVNRLLFSDEVLSASDIEYLREHAKEWKQVLTKDGE